MSCDNCEAARLRVGSVSWGRGSDPSAVQVFLEAMGSPCPPLRCATTQLLAPLARLRLTDGSAYVQAMHDFVFGRGEAGGDQP